MSTDNIARQTPEKVADLVLRRESDFAAVLPTHIAASRWTRLVVSKLRQNTELALGAQSNPASLWAALQEAAALGLQPGTDEYYLTPRKDKGKRGILGIVGYQGQVELMFRAGAVSSVIVETVHANDSFEWVPGRNDRPVHSVDWFGPDRGDVIGAYAYGVMAGSDAISKVVVIGPAEVKRAMDSSASAYSSHSPWQSDYAAMVKKTAVHQLSKWVPTSAEYRVNQLRASMQAAADVERQDTTQDLPPMPEPPEPQHPVPVPTTTRKPAQERTEPVDEDTGEIIEAEIIDEPIITAMQVKKLHAQLGELQVKDRDQKLALITAIIGHPVETSNHLTKDEARTCIERLEDACQAKDPAGALNYIMETAA